MDTCFNCKHPIPDDESLVQHYEKRYCIQCATEFKLDDTGPYCIPVPAVEFTACNCPRNYDDSDECPLHGAP